MVYLGYMSESATRSCGKMAPSRRVGSPMRLCSVADMDVGQGRELGAVSFAHRSFGITKPHSVRLASPHWRANAGHPHSVHKPYDHAAFYPVVSIRDRRRTAARDLVTLKASALRRQPRLPRPGRLFRPDHADRAPKGSGLHGDPRKRLPRRIDIRQSTPARMDPRRRSRPSRPLVDDVQRQ